MTSSARQPYHAFQNFRHLQKVAVSKAFKSVVAAVAKRHVVYLLLVFFPLAIEAFAAQPQEVSVSLAGCAQVLDGPVAINSSFAGEERADLPFDHGDQGGGGGAALVGASDIHVGQDAGEKSDDRKGYFSWRDIYVLLLSFAAGVLCSFVRRKYMPGLIQSVRMIRTRRR